MMVSNGYRLLVAFGVLIFFTSCPEKEPGCHREIYIDLPVTLTEMDTVRIGDTLILESCIVENLATYVRDTSLDLEYQTDIVSSIFISKISVEPWQFSTPSFNISALEGSARSALSGQAIDFTYVERTDNEKCITVQLIPTDPGVHVLGMSSQLDQFDDVFISNGCSYRAEIVYAINGRIDNNYNLLMVSQDSAWLAVSREDFDQGNVAFVVVE